MSATHALVTTTEINPLNSVIIKSQYNYSVISIIIFISKNT